MPTAGCVRHAETFRFCSIHQWSVIREYIRFAGREELESMKRYIDSLESVSAITHEGREPE